MTCGDCETRLDEYLDGALPPAEREAVEEHLSGCDACGASLDGLRALVAAASALPRDEAPPRDLWRGIRAALEPPGSAPARRVPAFPWRRVGLAAAAVVAVSVLATLLVERGTVAPGAPEGPPPGAAEAEAPPGTALAAVRGVETEYVRATDDLMRIFERRRGRLAPETVAEVERNLGIINQAIGDARQALEKDPGNRRLGGVVTAMYERKVDLLRYLTGLSVPGMEG